MKVDYLLNENEYSFEGSKIKDKNYIAQQLFSNGKSKLEFGQINMIPIIEAFSEK